MKRIRVGFLSILFLTFLTSCTMIATLVAEGKLHWESKLMDVIPALKETIHADQPWGHSSSWLRGKWQPDQTDNPEALGPAGRVHCSIEDWAKFLALQLKNENPILERKYLDKLIEAVSGHQFM